MALTSKDLQAIESLFIKNTEEIEIRFQHIAENIKEELTEKFDEIASAIKSDFYDKIDPVLKEVSANRQERTATNQRFTRIEGNIEELQNKVGITPRN